MTFRNTYGRKADREGNDIITEVIRIWKRMPRAGSEI